MGLTIAQAGSASSTSSGASLAITGVTAAVGDWLIVAVAADNAGSSGVSSVSGCSDGNNTYTNRGSTVKNPAGANTGTVLEFWTAPVTSALSNATVTISFSPNTAAKTAIIWNLTPDSGYEITYGTAGSGGTGNSSGPNITSSSITSEDTVFCFVAAEYGTYQGSPITITGDSDTSNGSWSSVFSGCAESPGGAGQSVGSQYKTVTGTGLQVWSVTLNVTADWAVNWLSMSSALLPSVPVKQDSYRRFSL